MNKTKLRMGSVVALGVLGVILSGHLVLAANKPVVKNAVKPVAAKVVNKPKVAGVKVSKPVAAKPAIIKTTAKPVVKLTVKEAKVEKIDIKQAEALATDFLKQYYFADGTTTFKVSIDKAIGGIYPIKLTIDGSSTAYTAAMSDDGKYFFPQMLEVKTALAEAKKQRAETEQQQAAAAAKKAASVIKSDKPVVELFVMSHCPYGTQMEKGILPVADLLGDKIDFKIKFVDYSMHGEKEVKEELNQYCIDKNEPVKYREYLKCFLKAGDGEACLKSTSIDTAKLEACVKETDTTYKIMDNLNDKTKWANGSFPRFEIYKADNDKYSVQGSPTLIINGAESEAGRDSASLLKAVCDSFNNQPTECSKELPRTTPAPGFGENTTNSNTQSSCGS